MTRHAVIVGAGIAGMTTSLCLARIGWRATVLEQAPVISEVGAGLQLSPNGMKVLRTLGLTAAIETTAFAPEAIEMRMGRSGRRVFRVPLGQAAVERWGAPYLQMHRADLLAVLLDAATAHDQIELRNGARAASVKAGCVRLDDGAEVAGDLVIGADGIHSIVRQHLLGEDQPRFTGNVAWRMTVPMERLGDLAPPPTACIWAGPGRHAVTYRLRGGTLANFVGVVEQDGWQEESWTEQGSRDAALADFAGWDPVLLKLIEAADTHFRWALHVRDPLPRWSDGPVLVLGDAAHPMLPTLAQGAVMGIEDAWVLTDLLDQGESPETVGQALHATRIARVSRVQATAARNVSRFHYRSPITQLAHYAPLWTAGAVMPGFVNGLQDWLYGSDVTE